MRSNFVMVMSLLLLPSVGLSTLTAVEIYAEGNTLWAEGKVADAYLSYQKSLNMEPSALWSSDALERLALLATTAPDEQLKVLGRAVQALAKGDNEGAINMLRDFDRSGLVVERLKPWLALWLARGLAAQKHSEEADGVLTAELSRHPQDPAAPRLVLEKIALRVARSDESGAAKLLEQMEKDYPESAELELAKGLLKK